MNVHNFKYQGSVQSIFYVGQHNAARFPPVLQFCRQNIISPSCIFDMFGYYLYMFTCYELKEQAGWGGCLQREE